eukprot:13183186-Heterocapsa_arctica.AAC.1
MPLVLLVLICSAQFVIWQLMLPNGRHNVTLSFIALCVTYTPPNIFVLLDGLVISCQRYNHTSLLMPTLPVVSTLSDLPP